MIYSPYSTSGFSRFCVCPAPKFEFVIGNLRLIIVLYLPFSLNQIIECPNGTHGWNCSLKCSEKTYGKKCEELCKCKSDEICDARDGSCSGIFHVVFIRIFPRNYCKIYEFTYCITPSQELITYLKTSPCYKIYMNVLQ
jgi:hypothetical protein